MLGDKGNSVGSAGGSNYSGDGKGGQVNMDGVGKGGTHNLRMIDGRWTRVAKDGSTAPAGGGQTFITPASYPPTAPTVATPPPAAVAPVTPITKAPASPPNSSYFGDVASYAGSAPPSAPAVNTFRTPVSGPKTRTPAPSAPKVNSTAVAAGLSSPAGLSGALKAAVNPTARDDRMPSVPQAAAPTPKYSTPATPTAPGTYSGPKGVGELNTAARMAQANLQGFSPAAVTRVPGDAEAMARMANAESGQITNDYGMPNTTALQGTMDVMRNRMLSEKKFGKTLPGMVPGSVQDVITQKSQFSPYADGSYAKTAVSPTNIKLAEGVLSGEVPSVVGNALNYANTSYLKTKKGIAESSAATRRAFDAMPVTAAFADAKKKGVMHSFGTIGTSDVAFNAPKTPTAPATQVASVQPSYKVAGASMAPPAAKVPTTSQVAANQASELSVAIEKVRQSLAQPAGTLTTPYDKLEATRIAAGTPTAAYDVQPKLLDGLRTKAQKTFDAWKAERAAKANVAKAAGTLTSAYDAPEDLTKAAYDKAQVGVEDLRRSAYEAQKPAAQQAVSGPSTRSRLPGPPASVTQPVSGPKSRAALNLKTAAAPPQKAYDPATGYGAPAPDLKAYTQSPEDLARQATQVAQFKQSIKKGIDPNLAATLSPVADAMKYYDKNKWSIGVANRMGLLEKPVTKVAGAAITQMQNFIKDLGKPRPKDVSPAKPGNLIAGVEVKPPTKTTKIQVAETMVKEPEIAIVSSPELQKLATKSPTFLQRLFADAGLRGGKGNKFKEYLAQVAQTPTPTGTLNDNDSITAMFKSLAGSTTA
jgi:hypothetical protein